MKNIHIFQCIWYWKVDDDIDSEAQFTSNDFGIKGHMIYQKTVMVLFQYTKHGIKEEVKKILQYISAVFTVMAWIMSFYIINAEHLHPHLGYSRFSNLNDISSLFP